MDFDNCVDVLRLEYVQVAQIEKTIFGVNTTLTYVIV